ncbi:hypothetical protein V1264_018993 [Littorina saxatilis]|uniref:Malate dehydrogenase enzyme N-terminal domain-containing protein n=2 Tax=Littorina saxatilis TaxID=31220 RepID=A0AAN9GE29_9CAEN
MQTKSKTTKKTPSFQDAYEFNESDEFINGLGDSFLFTPASKSSRQKVPKKVTQKVPKTVTLIKVKFQSNTLKKPNSSKVPQKGKKDELTSLSKSVKAVREKKVSDRSQKKTSTPLLSESVNSASTEKQGSSLSRVRRSPRIIIPRLNLDLSVTPILPVANGTPVFQSLRVRAKKLEGNDPNVDSFMCAQKPKSPQETPSCPGEKVERRASLRRAAVTVQTSESLTPTGTACVSKIRGVSKVSVVVEKKDLKRKQSESKPLGVKAASSVTSTSVKRQKPAQSQSTEKKQNQASAKVSNSAAKSLNSKQQAYLKLNSEKTAASLSSKYFTRPRKPAPKSMPVQQKDAADNDVDSSPSLHDSGISFGSDSASSRATDASGNPSLPGFMEDEPLQSDLQDLSSPLFSSPNFEFDSTSTSAKDPESILNKSSSKEYTLKTGKAKREKGRYSTAKVDAWASATNQSLDELESFELVVE